MVRDGGKSGLKKCKVLFLSWLSHGLLEEVITNSLTSGTYNFQVISQRTNEK